MSDVVVGIDVGTTVVKSAAFALADLSAPIAVHRRPAATRSPRPGWAEADPVEVERLAFGTLRAVAEEVGPERIAAVGIAGTACGAWLIDAAGAPVRPGILWNDGRAAAIVERWRSDGLIERIFAVSGNVPYPGYTLPTLAWLAEHEPDALARSAALLWPKDWLRYRLTGEIGSDEGDASYVPFDIRRRAWSEELLELAGVAGVRAIVPALARSGARRPPSPGGNRGHRVAGRHAGGGRGDGHRRRRGRRGRRRRGAGGHPLRHQRQLDRDHRRTALCTVCGRHHGRGAARPFRADDGQHLRFGDPRLGRRAALCGRRRAARDIGRRGFGQRRRRGRALPQPRRRRLPFVDPLATGTIAGLRSHHGPAHLARATVEGLAYAVADGYACMPVPVDHIVAVGGAARSDLLLQSLADAGGTPVARLRGEEFGARGAALLAGWATGLIDDLEAAAGRLATEREFAPRSDGPLAGGLARYRAVATANRGVAA